MDMTKQELIEMFQDKSDNEIKTGRVRKPISNILERLSAYQKLEKEGRLIELPCKIGDMIYEVAYNPYLQKKIVREIPFTARCLNDRFELNNFLFKERAEAEGYILLLDKIVKFSSSIKEIKNKLTGLSFDARYDNFNEICHMLCKESGADILSAEFVSEANDYLESEIENWRFIALPTDVHFESQVWARMEAEKNLEEPER